MPHSPALLTCIDTAVDFAEPRVPLLIKKALCLLQGLAVLGAGSGHRLNGHLGAGMDVSCQHRKHKGSQRCHRQHGEQLRALQAKTSHARGQAALWTPVYFIGTARPFRAGSTDTGVVGRVPQGQLRIKPADPAKPTLQHLPLQTLGSLKSISRSRL